MSQKQVKHCVGLQGLWPPYSVAYCGVLGEHTFSLDASEDRILVLDKLLEKMLLKVGNIFEEEAGISLAFPQGPGPFTGLRAVAAFACGLQAGKSQVLFCTPTAFTLCSHALPEGRAFVCLPHHKRAVFCGECVKHDGRVDLKSLRDIAPQDVQKMSGPVYWCGAEQDEAYGMQALAPITAQKCAQYAWCTQQHTQTPDIMYPPSLQKASPQQT